ncbi:MAG: hypothetical protein CVU44_20935 [Chloroflexi bacterium HGW-Chloroflexi-6]|nr:MAG: hypothetical protein CVU44_20935 [Chloroflexi bacterium HGW-Chloroflexi-6]
MKQSAIGYLLFALFLAACGAYFWESEKEMSMVRAAPETDRQPVILATATLYIEPVTVTPAPTIYVTPTPNEAATIAQINLEAANKNLEASGRQATAIVDAARIAAQALAQKSESDERLAGQAVLLQELVNKGKTIDAMMLSFGLRRDEINLAHDQLNEGKNRVWVEALWASALICLAAAMVVTALLRRSVQHAAPVKQVLHVEKPGGGTERIPAPPVQDYESFMAWAGAVVAGETVAVDHWEQSGMFVGSYRKVHSWLVRWHLIMRHPKSGRAVLNPTGERVLVEWIIAYPLPHNNESAKKAALSSVHTDSVTTETVGEGLSGDSSGGAL